MEITGYFSSVKKKKKVFKHSEEVKKIVTVFLPKVDKYCMFIHMQEKKWIILKSKQMHGSTTHTHDEQHVLISSKHSCIADKLQLIMAPHERSKGHKVLMEP